MKYQTMEINAGIMKHILINVTSSLQIPNSMRISSKGHDIQITITNELKTYTEKFKNMWGKQ
jgi:hypothetical protein